MELINDVICNLSLFRWPGRWLWFCWMVVERGNRQADQSVCFLLSFTFISVALNTVLTGRIQCTLAGFVLSSSTSVTELVYFCCEDKRCCLNSVRGLTRMSRSTMSGLCKSCPCVGWSHCLSILCKRCPKD